MVKKMNITVRNIPEEIIDKIRTISRIEKRSINNEILIILENGLNDKLKQMATSKSYISRELQIGIWRRLSEKWKEEDSEDIVRDINEKRSMGRDVDL